MSSGAFASGSRKVFLTVFSASDFDVSAVSVDGTIMQAHAKASGSEKSGLTSKTVALTDTVGKLIRFVVLPGQSHDLLAVPALLDAFLAIPANWSE